MIARAMFRRLGAVPAAALLLLTAAFPLAAQDGSVDEDAMFGGSTSSSEEDAMFGGSAGSSDGSSSEDDMFGSDSMVEEIGEPENTSDGGEYLDFLVSEDVVIGGSMSSSLTSLWGWSDGLSSFSDIPDADNDLVIDLSGAVFLDARPSSDLRIFMKAKTSYPFNPTYTAVDGSSNDVDFTTANIELFEFYSDVNWNERVFFRFGKQTVNWGVGYFYSPADIISLVPVDPSDPEAEREGPVAIKMTIPVGLTAFDAYLIGDETVRELSDLGYAARLTSFIRPVELSIGLGYQQDRPFRLVSTLQLPYRDWVFFGEARGSFGRQGSIMNDTTGLNVSDDDDFYLSATGGFRYMKQNIGESDTDFTSFAQYYFHGEGYDDADYYTAALTNATFGDASVDSYFLSYPGQHYSAVLMALSSLGSEDLSASVLWQANWTDISGVVNSYLTYELFDGLNITWGVVGRYGDDSDQYSYSAFLDKVQTYITVDMGGGSF